MNETGLEGLLKNCVYKKGLKSVEVKVNNICKGYDFGIVIGETWEEIKGMKVRDTDIVGVVRVKKS